MRRYLRWVGQEVVGVLAEITFLMARQVSALLYRNMHKSLLVELSMRFLPTASYPTTRGRCCQETQNGLGRSPFIGSRIPLRGLESAIWIFSILQEVFWGSCDFLQAFLLLVLLLKSFANTELFARKVPLNDYYRTGTVSHQTMLAQWWTRRVLRWVIETALTCVIYEILALLGLFAQDRVVAYAALGSVVVVNFLL